MSANKANLATIVENRRKAASTPVFPSLGKLSEGRYKNIKLTQADKDRHDRLENAKNRINLGYEEEQDLW